MLAWNSAQMRLTSSVADSRKVERSILAFVMLAALMPGFYWISEPFMTRLLLLAKAIAI
jgi:hypothetical protein